MALVAYVKNEPQVWSTFRINKSIENQIPLKGTTIYRMFSGGKALSGYKNSSWKDQIRDGLNATTPLVASDSSLQIISEGIYHILGKTAGGVSWDQSGSFTSFFQEEAFDSSLQTSVDNQARTKAIQQLSSDFKGLTFLSELREAISMIRSPASGLRKGIDKYCRYAERYRSRAMKTRKGLIEFRKAMGDSWLEYAFGWKPLINDIQAGFDALSDRVTRPEYAPFKATYTQQRNVPRRKVTNGSEHQIAWDIYLSGSEECSSYYQGTVKTFCTTSGLPEKLGLFPSEFVPTAWEIVPWSFLIDYFGNIGEVLDCWATVQRLTFGYVSSGSRRVRTSFSDVHFKPNGIGGAPLVSSQIGQAVVSRKNVTRTSLTTLPLPVFQMKSKLSNSKLLNIAALIAGMKLDSQFRVR